MHPDTLRERLDWLACLIASYEYEHDPAADVDQSATWEMLNECRALHADLLAQLPPEPAPEYAPPLSEDEVPF